MLKILLANLSGLTRSERYAYGYYPSAEEFDQESPLAWALRGNFNNRHRYPESFKTTYQPKFLYNKERRKCTKDSSDSKCMKRLNISAKQNPINEKIDFVTKARSEPLNESIIENKRQVPVYFSNPKDGKVFIISDVMNENVKHADQAINKSFPILITKEQYDNDLLLLKQTLLKQCHGNVFLEASGNTNTRPSIIRLFKPPDVIVKTQLTVNDNEAIRSEMKKPLIQRKQSLSKIRKNLKKFKPPGRKPLKPANALNTIVYDSTLSPIKTVSEISKLSTQLEKPVTDAIIESTVYSRTPLTSIKGYMTLNRQEISDKLNFKAKIRKRSVKELKPLKNYQLVKSLNRDFKADQTKSKDLSENFYDSMQGYIKSHSSHRHGLEDERVKKYLKIYLITNQTQTNNADPVLKGSANISKDDYNRVFMQSVYKNALENIMKRKAKAKVNQSEGKFTTIFPNVGNLKLKFGKVIETELKLKRKRSVVDEENFPKGSISLRNLENQTAFNNQNTSEHSSKHKKIKKKKFKRKIIDRNEFKRLGNRSDSITTARSEVNRLKHNRRNQLEADYSDYESDDYYENDHEEYEEDKNPDYYTEYSIEDSHTASATIEDYTETTEKVNVTDSQIVKPPYSEYIVSPTRINTKSPSSSSSIKKRIRRRPSRGDYYDDDDDDDDDEFPSTSLTSNISGFLRLLFYPVQMVMSNILDNISPKRNKDNTGGSSHYISYHNTLKQQSNDDYYEDEDSDYGDDDDIEDNSFGNWFSSWFSFNRRNKKIGSTTTAPNKRKPSKTSSSWLPSWLKFGGSKSEDDYDDYEKWFSSWFGDTKVKGSRRRPTTTTSTTTQIPQVPILTIVDPMRNPQNWIGILTNHMLNNATTTHNPTVEAINRITTEDPEIPHKITYDKYQIWRLKPQDDSQVKILEDYKRSDEGIKLQWLKGPSLRGLTDVLVPPRMLVNFQGSLTFESIDHEVLIFDVGKAIAYEKTKEDSYYSQSTKNLKKHVTKLPPVTPMSWRKYYGYEDIIKYTENMRLRYPQLVDLLHIGRSYEGRPLVVVKIESKEVTAANNAAEQTLQKTKLSHKKRPGVANAVFIEAGTHGLEWIGPATATWIINELLKIMKTNTGCDFSAGDFSVDDFAIDFAADCVGWAGWAERDRVFGVSALMGEGETSTVLGDQSFIRNTTWYIMPVLNPDSYVYSHHYDRFWKKSRSLHVSRPTGLINSAMTWLKQKKVKEKICFGVDLDRNWHYQWGRRGSSKSPCNEFFAGPGPFSEPETKTMAEFLLENRSQIKLFISLQAYGQILSYPIKINASYNTERLEDMLDVAMVGIDGLRKKFSKSRYKIDTSNDLIENRSGCSDAFAAYEVGIPFAYTLQLADNGVHGYLLPSAAIESTAADAFEMIISMLDYI
uniref:Peptidase M14 domain-containing protein n=1 Tax=Glossina morsitans morsitans TaxID=37546 RepID=A0A1B0FKY4_GLOMM